MGGPLEGCGGEGFWSDMFQRIGPLAVVLTLDYGGEGAAGSAVRSPLVCCRGLARPEPTALALRLHMGLEENPHPADAYSSLHSQCSDIIRLGLALMASGDGTVVLSVIGCPQPQELMQRPVRAG